MIRSFVSDESRTDPSKTSKPRCLDPVERRPVEAGEGRDAGGAAGVERVEQPEPFVQVRPRARGLERHQRPPLRPGAARGDVVLGDAVGGQLVLRQVDAAELPVLAHVSHDVDQLQRHAERRRPLDVVRAVDRDARDPDRAGDAAAVAVELGEVGVAVLLGVLQAAVDEVVERAGRDRRSASARRRARRTSDRAQEPRRARRPAPAGARASRRPAARRRRRRPRGGRRRRSPRSPAACPSAGRRCRRRSCAPRGG